MKIYIVQTKVFYTTNGIEHQVADALEPLTTYSSKKKAEKALEDYENYYEVLGYKRTDKYNNLFPVEHFTMKKDDIRTVIYLLECEVQ